MPGLLRDWPDSAGPHPQRLLEIEQVLGQLTAVAAVTYSASMTVDSSTAGHATITASNTSAFTINAPTNAKKGRLLTFDIANSSGGSLGSVTWNAAFKLDSNGWTSPANGKRRTITFRFDGTSWVQVGPTSADI